MTPEALGTTMPNPEDLALPPDTMVWVATRHKPAHIRLTDVVGMTPDFLRLDDPHPAVEQIDGAYIGGWRPQDRFTLDPENGGLRYPGDPVMYPWAMSMLRDEVILIYPYGYTLILQPDGAFAISRLD